MKAKIGVLFLVLMVGMAAVGASYALWSKTITLTGTVATGTVGMEWSPFTSNDVPGQGDPGIDWITELDTTYTKDVAACSVTNSADTTTVTITNAYPSYACTVTGDIHSTGTVPIEVYLDPSTIPAGIEVITTGQFVPTGPFNWVAQLHQGDSIVGGYKIHVLQTGDGSTPQSYSFSVKAVGRQFNEPRTSAIDT